MVLIVRTAIVACAMPVDTEVKTGCVDRRGRGLRNLFQNKAPRPPLLPLPLLPQLLRTVQLLDLLPLPVLPLLVQLLPRLLLDRLPLAVSLLGVLTLRASCSTA